MKEIATVYKEVRKLRKIARELFPDKKDQELLEPMLEEFKKIISEDQACGLTIGIKRLLNVVAVVKSCPVISAE